LHTLRLIGEKELSLEKMNEGIEMKEKKNSQVRILLKLHKLEKNGNGVGKLKTFQNLEKNLDPALLKRYQKLKERKGTAVAVLENGVCSGCQMVYPESHEMMRYTNFIRTCEYCGRLLVVTEKSVKHSVA
jgi:predicted  nucleic acid-binding Zn-ribbon protein